MCGEVCEGAPHIVPAGPPAPLLPSPHPPKRENILGRGLGDGMPLRDGRIINLMVHAAPMSPNTNITPIAHRVSLEQRESRSGHVGGVLWLTGLSGAGKSTLAFALEERLFHDRYQIAVLDGDNIRGALSADLSFSHADRTENIRRVAHVAALFAAIGFVCISAFISPYRADREMARRAATRHLPPGRFHEVYIRAGLETCERRDPKGLYKKARAGEIQGFTAVDDVYETPERPSLVIDTTTDTVAQSLGKLADFVRARFGAPGIDQPSEQR